MNTGPEPKNIVVLGAGFGGITALLKLHRLLKRRGLLAPLDGYLAGRGRYRLTLISQTVHHLLTPSLYEIAAIPRGEASARALKSTLCIPVEEIIAHRPGVRFIAEAITGLDAEARTVTLAHGQTLPFEYAVIALGAETNFFGVPGLAEHAYPLKTFADAVRLRNRIQELAAHGAGPLGIVVGGAGATGVELSAELSNYLSRLRERVVPGTCGCSVTLVEALPEILPGFNPRVIGKARERLAALGVRVITHARIQQVAAGTVILEDGRNLPYQLLVWAGGVRPPAALPALGLPLTQQGWIAVNEFLQAKPRIYAIGDCVGSRHPKTGRPLPKNVPVAEAHARLAALNVVAEITGGRLEPFRPLTRYPYILAVGGKYALTDLVILRFSSFLGWAAKQLVELRYLLFILPWPKAIKVWLRGMYYYTRND